MTINKKSSTQSLLLPIRSWKSVRTASQAGVTLVELLIYMGLFMGFLLLLSGLFVSILDVQRESVETARIEEDSQFLFSRLQYDISRAVEITTPAGNGETSQSLTMTSPEGIEINYLLENNQIKIASSSSPVQNLSHPEVAVTQLNFRRLGNVDGFPSIRTEITLQSSYEGQSNPEQRNLIYTFGTRQN